MVANKGTQWPELTAIAAEAIDSGRAMKLLENWIGLAK